MTTLDSLLPVRHIVPRPCPRTEAKTSIRPGGMAWIATVAALFGLLPAAASPGAAHALDGAPDAASDTLKVTLSVPDGGTVAEGATGHFEVSVAGGTASGAVTVRYSVSGTAVAGEDYTALSGTATVARGENATRIALEALDDGILDKGETVVLALTGATGPGEVVVDGTEATATIIDDGTVTIALAAVTDTIGEGSAWRSSVTMSTPVADRVSVRWWTSDGTAVAGRDYEAADEVLNFAPGETAKPVEVKTLRDSNTEPVETFHVSLGPPADAVGGASAAGLNFAGSVSAFIACSVEFPPPFPKYFKLPKPVGAGHPIGTVAANTTDGIPYYQLDDGGENKFTINSLTAEITTTDSLEAGGFYELEVTVQDECGAEASVDVNVKVNAKPTVAEPIPDDTVTVNESASVDASDHFSDPDGDKLTYTATSSSPTMVTVSVSGSTVKYTGKAVGRATVSVTAKDDGGLSATDDFEVTVVDEAPVFDQKSYRKSLKDSAPIGTRVVEVSAKDPEGKAVTYSLSGSGSDKFAIDEKTGLITVADSLSVTTYHLTAKAKDPAGNAGKAPVTVEVEPDGEPVFDPPSYSVSISINASDVVTVSAKDPEGLPVKYSMTGSDKFAIDENTGEITVAGTLSLTTYELTAIATDPPGNPGTAPVDVEVVNDPPTVTAGASPNPAEEGQKVSLTGTADDPEDQSMTYLWEHVSGSPQVTITNATKLNASFTAPPVATETDLTFRLTATDPHGASGGADTTVTVHPKPPECTIDVESAALSVRENEVPGTKLSGEVEVDSKDCGDLSYALTGTGSGDFSVSAVSGRNDNGKISVARSPNHEARDTYNLTLAVSEAGGTASDAGDVVISVTDVNEAPKPKGRIGDRTVRVGQTRPVDVTGYFTDEDEGDRLTFTSVSSATGKLTVNASGSPVRLTGVAEGTATVTVTARDRGGLTAKQSFEVEIEPDTTDTNEAPEPVGNIPAQSVERGKSGGLDVAGYFRDPDGDDLTYRAASSKTGVTTVSVTGSRVAFNGIAVGEATITVTARDPGGEEAEQQFKVTVTDPPPPTNRAPRVESAIPARSVESGKTVSVRVSSHFSDPDGDALTYTVKSSATAVATVSVNGSTVSVKGVAKGRADVTVTARDPGGKTASQRFRVTVTDPPPPTNRAPEIESAIPARSVESGKTVSVRVSSHFSDPDGDALTYTVKSSATAVATVSVSGSTVSVKGVAKGRADVTVTATDPGGKTASQSFRVTVTDPVPGNRAPVFASAAFERSVAENSPGGAAVGAPVTATDPDGDAPSYALASGGDAGLFGIGAATGRITVAAGAVLDHESAATHSVSVVASDGTLADTAAVTIKVTDVPPPGRPAKPVVTGGDGQVTATWQAPSNTGPAITGYDVRHRAASASGWTEASLGVVLEHTVKDLPTGTAHLVQVRAVSPEGAGAWSEPGEGTTAEAANRAPSFASAAFERSVPEHSPAGTAVGAPVTASDVDGDTLS
ncbi:MAG: hypothetical protein F4087_12180, partial [Gemmatimonadetes bacterium]|nr:hypothetical protein [Gemmatimonadota bacterium]